MWVNENVKYAREANDFMKDRRYEVEPEKRSPGVSVQEFYKTRDERIRNLLTSNLDTFGDPDGGTVGTPNTNGFNVCIPKNAMWIDGRVDLNRKEDHDKWQTMRRS